MYLSSSALLAVLLTATSVAGAPNGKKIQWMGHSFHFFLPQPVAQLAKEAGISGHVNVGIDRIGASLPCQHWNRGGETGTNPVKEVLKAGKADVLTISTREKAPDECIPKFVDLGFQRRKDMHVMVHETWLPYSTNKAAEGCYDSGWGCANRDGATLETLQSTHTTIETDYRNRLRGQLAGINTRLGTNITTLVPVWDAVLSMREMVVKGELPGVTKQSSLFADALGHPTKPLQDMASYMWFGALYGLSPIGSQVLARGTAAGQAAALQKLAWDTLKREPLNGLA